MTFHEFARFIDNNYIICENYDERDAVVEFFRKNGVGTDATMRLEMHTANDRWLYPYYDSYDKELHATSVVDREYEDCVDFADIADVIFAEECKLVVPELVGLLA